MHRQAMGAEGMTLAALAAVAMAATAFFVGPHLLLSGDMGTCLRSPNEWGLAPLPGWIFNVGVLAVAAFTLYLVNRRYSFVPGADTVLTGMFALLTASNIWVSGSLSSSGLLAISNIICLLVLFGCYRKRNASQELCVIATILSMGSMIQYAFIFMIPVYIVGSALMKCLSFKSLVAFIMGLAAPYWVGIGLGLVPLDSFTMPTMTNLFDGYIERGALFAGLVNVGLTALLSLILALSNLVKLYAGNTQRRMFNNVIYILGLVCLICIVVDAFNMVAYLGTLYFVAAVQIANLFALRRINRSGRVLFALCLLYIAGFAVMMTGK